MSIKSAWDTLAPQAPRGTIVVGSTISLDARAQGGLGRAGSVEAPPHSPWEHRQSTLGEGLHMPGDIEDLDQRGSMAAFADRSSMATFQSERVSMW